MAKDGKGHGSNARGGPSKAINSRGDTFKPHEKTGSRYEVRPINSPAGKHGVFDNHLKVWQTAKPTKSAAQAWIKDKAKQDKNPAPSTLKVRMPVKD